VIGVVRFLYLLALAVWVGEIVFFSFVVAPAVFAALGPAGAGEIVGAIFPRYYALGTAAAATALACAIVLTPRAAAPTPWAIASIVVAVGLAATLWAGRVVEPRAHRLRAELHASGRTPSESPEFRAAHRTAVILNVVALVAGVAGLGLSAAALRQ
jgi:uncharacterized membrane protein